MTLPVSGFPAVAIQPLRHRRTITDEFLVVIARVYLTRGRGYAASLAQEYSVSPRTVVSWLKRPAPEEFSARHPVRGRPEAVS